MTTPIKTFPRTSKAIEASIEFGSAIHARNGVRGEDGKLQKITTVTLYQNGVAVHTHELLRAWN